MVSPISPHDPLMSPSNEASEPVDHYAILELDPHASEEDVRTAYRRLRVVYFQQSDAKKYRALQAAFDVLMDPEARQAYDSNYTASAPTVGSMGEVLEQPKHGRKDSGHSSAGKDAQTTIEEEEEEIEAIRNEDPNWGLKRQRRLHNPVIGSESYHSFVPILQAYRFQVQHPLLKCRRPTYVLRIARNAWPN
jgi:curved DNA-binding protein CbpA